MTGDSQFCTAFLHFLGMFFFQIIYTDIVFETFCSSSVKYSHKQKDTEKSAFHIKLLKYDE